MSRYAVRLEGERPGVIDKRITSVIFPRALKESVLLHTILGHEVGHSIISAHVAATKPIREALLTNSSISDPSALETWCKQHLGITESTPMPLLKKVFRNWADEFLCDIFGLIIMGPSFLPAFWSLLEIRSFRRGDLFVPTHPPFEARALTLLHAARALGMIYSTNGVGKNLLQLTEPLDSAFTSAVSLEPHIHTILDPQQVAKAAVNFKLFAEQFKTLTFETPDEDLLRGLIASIDNTVPPSGRFPVAYRTETNTFALLDIEDIDFRHILLAGWLAWCSDGNKTGETFLQINSLCSFAIMQQEGIKHWNRGNNRLSVVSAQ